MPGLEVAGYIHELGEGVEELHEGQPVAAFVKGGGYAEFVLAEADLTIALEGSWGQLDLATAAAFPMVVCTAYDLLSASQTWSVRKNSGSACWHCLSQRMKQCGSSERDQAFALFLIYEMRY